MQISVLPGTSTLSAILLIQYTLGAIKDKKVILRLGTLESKINGDTQKLLCYCMNDACQYESLKGYQSVVKTKLTEESATEFKKLGYNVSKLTKRYYFIFLFFDIIETCF